MDLIGVDVLGFTKEDMGLHSICSGGSMAMFLSKVETIIMMRIGRWSSDTFLEYIREQVENFMVGVSQRMLEFEHYFVLGQHKSQDTSITSVNTSTLNNENGPEEVAFGIRFSDIEINENANLTHPGIR